MKKLFGVMVALVAFLPILVNAQTKLSINCTDPDADNNKTCTVGINSDEILAKHAVKLTEKGGATIDPSTIRGGIDWQITGTPTKSGDTYTVNLESSGFTGEGDLLTFTYKVSGTTDCAVILDGSENSSPNPQTGPVLPYVALGLLAVAAGYAYISTKNKTKMFNI